MDLQSLLQGLAAVLLVAFAVSLWITLLEAARVRKDAEGNRARKGASQTQGGGRPSTPANPVSKGSTKDVAEGLSRWLAKRRLQSKRVDYAAVLVEVAARLQAGAPTADAWRKSWSRVTGADPGEVSVDGVPSALRADRGTVAQVIVTSTSFSALTGAPLKDVLGRTAEALIEMEKASDAQEVAFAGPRLSAKVLTFLPLAGVLGASVLGAEPLVWFTSGLGPALVALLGAALTVAGHVTTRGMVEAAAKVSYEQVVAPVYCDLVASGMRGGSSVPSALKALGQASGESQYKRVGAELMLGASWAEAWEPTPPAGQLLKRGLQPAWEDGVSAVEILTTLANRERARSAANAKQEAERLGVKLAFPLAGLLLPAFILLGLVPVFMSLFGSEVLPAFGG